MKILTKGDATEHKNAVTCTAYEYETSTPDINIARIEINGRYPATGSAVNTAVSEIVYVIAGSGIITSNDVSVELSEGDVVSIAPGERVYWEGNLSLVIACSPAWSPEQYENTL